MPAATPLREIHRLIADRSDRGDAFAVITVLRADGSTPVDAGSRAMVDAAGCIVGTVGGGAVEAEAQRRAVESIKNGQPVVFEFSLRGAGPPVMDPVCGGEMRVLVDPRPERHRRVWLAAAEAREQRRRGVLLTTVRGISSTTQTRATSQLSSVGITEFILDQANVHVEFSAHPNIEARRDSPAQEVLDAAVEEEEPRWVVLPSPQVAEQGEVLIEPLLPKPRLLIVGGGHVGRAVAHQADTVGFDVTVLDDREGFARPALFPDGATALCGDIRSEVEAFPFEPDTFVVIVTRGHTHDATALAACLRRPAAYVGMIGSRRKVAMVRKDFIESGRATAEEFDRVYAPIGIDIGAVTVPEIATSIVAQLVAVRRRGAASRMPTA